MTFPLIVQPSPTQQLADMLAGIRERSQLRQRRDLENRLLDQQIVSGKMADWRADQTLALDQQRLTDARKIAELQELDRRADNVRQDAIFQAAVQQRAIENRRAEVEAKQKLLRDFLSVFPEGTVIPARLRTAVMRQATGRGNPFLAGASETPDVDLVGEVTQAMGRSRPGLQGSAVRNPQPGRSDAGVTFFPGTVNINAPSGGGGTKVTTQDRLMQAAIGGALDQMVAMEDLERRNPLNATIPPIASVLEGAGNLPVVGGMFRGGLGPLSQQSMTPEQQQYQAMAGEFIHTYASALPGRRLGPELLRVIHHNFFPRAGQNDPETIARFAARRREAATRMARAAAGEAVDLEGLLDTASRSALERLSPRAESSDVSPQVNVEPLSMPTIRPRYVP